MSEIRKMDSQVRTRTTSNTPTDAPRMAVASGLGGFAGAVVSNAPRVLKTRAQLQLAAPRLGMRAAVHGLPLHGAVSSVANFWCFTVQHLVKSTLGAGCPAFACSLASGLGAGVSESLLTNPARRVLVRHATAANPQTLRQVAHAVLQDGGWSGLWRGASSGAVRNGVGWGSYFATLNVLRGDKQSQSTMRNALDSSMACAVACCVAMPFDTIVTHMQDNAGRSAWAIGAEIAKKQGVKGLYAGLGQRLAQAVPASTVSFVVMTQALRLDSQRQSNR